MTASTTITILEARLSLVRIPRSQLHASMASVLDCWWFRRQTDPFFALCLNALEVSLFADAQVVRRTFAEYMSDEDQRSDEEDETWEVEEDAAGNDEDFAGASGFTLGGSDYRRERRDYVQPPSGDEEERISVGEDVWVALEIAFHGDGWESAGLRVHALSSPLADAGISILFLSTYQADFILVKQAALVEVTAILEKSGFQFNAVDSEDDDDDEILGLDGSMANLGGLSRQASLRRQRGEGSNGGSARASMTGSLTLSDRGSIGSGKSSAPSTTMSMSRSASISRAVAAAAAAAAAASAAAASASSSSSSTPAASSPLAVDGLTLSPAPLTPSPSTTPLPLPTTPTPAFSAGNSLSLLPDELVCVGLAQGEPSETLWRTKIVTALFFPERVLPRMEEPGWESTPPRRARKSEGMPTASTRLFTLSSHDRSTSRGTRPGRPSPMSRSSTTTSAASGLSSSLCTSLAAPPVPFIALTQTADGTSLTADIRLLRALFAGDDSGAAGMTEEELVYAVGSGGLRGVWAGEEGDSDSETSEVEGDDRPRRGRGGLAPSAASASESEVDSEASEAEDWEHLSRSNSRRSAKERKERKEKARMAGEGGRRLLKCLQVDLVAFGLDKHGVVESIARILGAEGINCLYQSTYSSANILVSKSDIVRARRVLEEHGKQTSKASD